MIDRTRRAVVGGIGAALSTPFISKLAYSQSKPAKITVGTLGGAFEVAMGAFVKDFTERTGVAAQLVVGNPSQWVNQLAANPSSPPVDVMPVWQEIALKGGRQGLFETPTVEKVPNMADVPSMFVDRVGGFAIGLNYSGFGVAYNNKRLKNPPKSLKELIDGTIKGDYRTGLIGLAFGSLQPNLIWSFNDILGGTLDDISPAIQTILKMRPNSTFCVSPQDFLTQLSTGEVDIGLCHDGRAYAHIDAGNDWVSYFNPSEGSVMGSLPIAKPMNSHPIAWEFINSMMSPGPQSRYSDLMGGYGVSNSKVVYSEKTRARVAKLDALRDPPVAEIVERLTVWTDIWTREVGV